MSRGWKAAIGGGGFIVALNVALTLIHSLGGGTPGGPTSSSYATGATGAAAYASLLGRAGHRVERLRGRPGTERLDPATTLILIDAARPVASTDAEALRRFVAAGGRLVVGGVTGTWLDRIVPRAPEWSPTRVDPLRALSPEPTLARIHELDRKGRGSWLGGSALPLLGDGDQALLALAAVGAGSVWLLADASPLQNRLLDHADNAALGLALAGPPARPVFFLESYHGYGGAATGFAAVPGRWWTAFGLLALATLVLMVASGRRLGPPQADERELPPPRRRYVEALGSALARSRAREAAVRPVREHIRERIAERTGLGQKPSGEELQAAAVTLGIPAEEAAALIRPAENDADVLAVGRVLALVERESQP